MERRRRSHVQGRAHVHPHAARRRLHRLFHGGSLQRLDAADDQGLAPRFRPALHAVCRRSQERSRSEERMKVKGQGTTDKPWVLKTPPGTSEYEAYRDSKADPPAVVVQVGKTQLRYHLRCIDDLHAMLAKHGDWV